MNPCAVKHRDFILNFLMHRMLHLQFLKSRYTNKRAQNPSRQFCYAMDSSKSDLSTLNNAK